MNRIFANTVVGRKNIGFGIGLFLLLGVAVGIPLTMDFLGGSLLTDTQYQVWKVLHGYGVFLAFVNFFFGYSIDRHNMSSQQKEISSWSFVIAGSVGGIGRPVLFILSGLGGIGSYAISLIETLGFVIGTFFFIRGLFNKPSHQPLEKPVQAVSESL